MPSGTTAATPARSSRRVNAAVAPIPSAGPNMLPTQAGRNTATGSTPGAPTTEPSERRDDPPLGNSAE